MGIKLRNTLITAVFSLCAAAPPASASHGSKGPSKSQQAQKDAAHHAERGNSAAAKAAQDRVKSRERAEKIQERNDAKKSGKRR